MLFDLQSRRRRTAVKFIYLLLAILMGGGLVLFGVGAGNGNGGLLNSFTGGSSSGHSTQDTEVTQQLKAAEKRVAANPKSAGAWANLLEARYQAAGADATEDSSTGQEVYSAAGKAELKQAITAWLKYSSLVKGTPDQSTILLAARSYSLTGNFAGATLVWQDFIQTAPGQLKGYECLAYTSYASKKTTLGDEAAAKAVALSPKLDQLQVKQDFKETKASVTEAKAAAADC